MVTWLFVAENMAIFLRIVEPLGSFCCDFGIMGGKGFFPMKLSLAKYLRQMVLLHGYQFLLHSLLLEILSSLVSFRTVDVKRLFWFEDFDNEFYLGIFH